MELWFVELKQRVTACICQQTETGPDSNDTRAIHTLPTLRPFKLNNFSHALAAGCSLLFRCCRLWWCRFMATSDDKRHALRRQKSGWRRDERGHDEVMELNLPSAIIKAHIRARSRATSHQQRTRFQFIFPFWCAQRSRQNKYVYSGQKVTQNLLRK